jgi:hypothetical protein
MAGPHRKEIALVALAAFALWAIVTLLLVELLKYWSL